MKISVIIPTLNEERNIGALLQNIKLDPSYPLVNEIIVVDGHSVDNTTQVAERAGAKVIASSVRQRASQMNLGAAMAQSDILFFLHADTIPPPSFAQHIWQANTNGNKAGCFRLKFDWAHWFLSFNSWFTRFRSPLLRFGDQSFFVKKEIFNSCNGFNDKMYLFEDQDIIKRLNLKNHFVVLPAYVVTSARKYRHNGPFSLQLAYFVLYLLYKLGFSQQRLLKCYLKLVPHPRI